MRSVLGYPVENNENTYRMEATKEQLGTTIVYRELEDCYPQIYKMINPIVCEVCDRHINASTKEEVEKIVEEVYQKVIVNNQITLMLNIDNRSIEKTENIRTNSNRIINNEPVRQIKEVENRQRKPNNNQFLRDLIRILILNRILGGGQGRPPRPRPPYLEDGRPQFPGGMMPRPPQPRNYEDYFKY